MGPVKPTAEDLAQQSKDQAEDDELDRLLTAKFGGVVPDSQDSESEHSSGGGRDCDSKPAGNSGLFDADREPAKEDGVFSRRITKGAAILNGLAWAVMLFAGTPNLAWTIPLVLLSLAGPIFAAKKLDDLRAFAVISVLALALTSGASLRQLEHDAVQDAYYVHREAIGCDLADKLEVYGGDRRALGDRQPPSDKTVERCEQTEDLWSFVFDMEKRGWGSTE